MKDRLLNDLKQKIDIMLDRADPEHASLWELLISQHPADIADICVDSAQEKAQQLFQMLPTALLQAVFKELPDRQKVEYLRALSEKERLVILHALHADELTDLFDYVSDGEVRSYMDLISHTARNSVLALQRFHPESAGGIMDPQVLTLDKDFTVEKSIKILQRIKPDKEVYQRIYITDKQHMLVGYIDLQDLVLHTPTERIEQFVKPAPLVVQPEQDREEVVHQMVHYHVTNAPVVSDAGLFLGVIPPGTLADVLVKEAGENVQRISALAPLKQTYFNTSFIKLFYERSGILIVLLLVESLSGAILEVYESTLGVVLLFFVPMIISTGGNTSSQTSAVAIQGMAAGDIRSSNMVRFLRRELMLGTAIGLVLGVTAFARVWFTTGSYMYSAAISLALGLIVLLSVVLGSCVPIVLKRMNVDPAFSAGPFLATAMDILGILIYCFIGKLILF